MSVEFLGVSLPNRSVLASGILGVTAASLRRVHRAGAGLVTTKSIGPAPRKGHAGPVMYDWGGGLINAVGLSNPGVSEFVSRFENEEIDFPLAVSVFGEQEQDFAVILEQLEKLPHRFVELNLSCPNVSDEFGTPFAFSPETTARIVGSAKKAQSRPVIAKLSSNTPDIAGVARAAEAAGADALCLSNTVGPGMVIDTATGFPVLSNKTGGVSGDAVLPITVSTVYQVYRLAGIPIIAVGGISTADGALQAMMAGAELYGVGTGVYTRGLSVFGEVNGGVRDFAGRNGLSEPEIVGMAHRTAGAGAGLGASGPGGAAEGSAGEEGPGRKGSGMGVSGAEKSTTAGYAADRRKFLIPPPGPEPSRASRPRFAVRPVVRSLTGPDQSVKTLLFERDPLDAVPAPGQFYMLWYPGEDQKPFSVSYLGDRYIGFSFVRRGPFTDALFSVEPGEPVGLLGPLGNGYSTDRDDYLLVGGGIGCAPLIYTALALTGLGKRVSLFAGGRTLNTVRWVRDLFDLEGEDRAAGLWEKLDVRYCTEDGTTGLAGMLTDHLDEVIDLVRPVFVLLCGPERFIQRSMELCGARGLPGEASIERVMKCGLGLCGSCSLDDQGERVCVDGPVFEFQHLRRISEFGNHRRGPSGRVIGID